MFMKIFIVLVISFNNIFTIPQNINNDEMTTQSLIRNKRQSDKIYNFEIRNLKKVQFWISTRKNNLNLYPVKQVVIEKKDNISLNEKLPELKNLNWLIFRFTIEFEDNQNKQDEIRQLITTHGQKIDENNDDTLWIINKKIAIKAQGTSLDTLNHDNNITNYRLNKTNDFKIEIEKDSTDIDLPEITTKFDGNHKYSDVIDNLDYLMIHRGDFDKFNYSYLYWTPVFNFIDTLEKGYYKEFTIKNHGFKNESYFYHKTSTILPNSEIIDPTNATKIEVIKKIKKRLNEAINNLAGVNNAIEGIDYNTEIKDNDNNYLDDDSTTFDLTTDNVADRTFTVKFTAIETSTQLQGTKTIKMVIPKQDDTNDNVLKIKAFNKILIAGNNYLQLLHGENEIWKYDTKRANDYYLIKYLFGTLNYLNVKFSFLRYDPDLRNDIYLYFKNNIPSINNSDYKNVFDEIYEILGNFFASLFYATFDMDEKTHTEIDFKGIENYKKDYFIQIGFFYRSLITLDWQHFLGHFLYGLLFSKFNRC